MRITGWVAEVSLTNGYVDTFQADYAPPGSTVVDIGVFAVYSEDCVGGTTGMNPMVPRATVTYAHNDGTNLSLSFVVDDPNVYNGFLWLHDSVGDYIGSSEFAVDWSTGATNTFILVTGPLDNSGGTNTFDLQLADIIFANGTVPMSEIAEVIVVLTDGMQYAGGRGWDYRSISAVFDL